MQIPWYLWLTVRSMGSASSCHLLHTCGFLAKRHCTVSDAAHFSASLAEADSTRPRVKGTISHGPARMCSMNDNFIGAKTNGKCAWEESPDLDCVSFNKRASWEPVARPAQSKELIFGCLFFERFLGSVPSPRLSFPLSPPYL